MYYFAFSLSTSTKRMNERERESERERERESAFGCYIQHISVVCSVLSGRHIQQVWIPFVTCPLRNTNFPTMGKHSSNISGSHFRDAGFESQHRYAGLNYGASFRFPQRWNWLLWLDGGRNCLSPSITTRCSVSQFLYFCKTLYMFQTVFPSIIRSSKLHIQRQIFVRPIPDAVCAVLSSWWWTKKPSGTSLSLHRAFCSLFN